MTLAIYFLGSCALFSPAVAEESKPAEPELVGVVYLLDSADRSFKPLPKAPAKVVSGRKGFTGGKGSIQIPEPNSSFHTKSGKDLEFVVRTNNPEGFELFAFSTKGQNREALVATAKGKVFGGGATTERVGRISFDTSKYGDSSYRFVVKAPETGEYGFAVGWFVFHFAVE